MKKILLWILSIALLSSSAFAVSSKTANWYFSSKSQNDRPSLPSVPEELAKGMGKDEKVIFLTFDAGYENGNVEKIVDILKENEVAGAFFVLKHFVEANPELCKKILKNGNLICNHTANHPSVARLSKEGIEKEIRSLEETYEAVTGEKMAPFFRPPEGAYTMEALKTVSELGYRTVFWSLAWADWDNKDQKSPEYAMEKLCSRVHNGTVLLLHPTSETNVKILGDFIRQMKEKGYRFASLEELWEK